MQIPISDKVDEDIMSILPIALRFIQNARKTGAVVVHCEAGVSRSATIVIAYVMKLKGLSAMRAFQFVEARRKFINPNRGFLRQLQLFERMKKVVDLSSTTYFLYLLENYSRKNVLNLSERIASYTQGIDPNKLLSPDVLDEFTAKAISHNAETLAIIGDKTQKVATTETKHSRFDVDLIANGEMNSAKAVLLQQEWEREVGHSDYEAELEAGEKQQQYKTELKRAECIYVIVCERSDCGRFLFTKLNIITQKFEFTQKRTGDLFVRTEDCIKIENMTWSGKNSTSAKEAQTNAVQCPGCGHSIGYSIQEPFGDKALVLRTDKVRQVKVKYKYPKPSSK